MRGNSFIGKMRGKIGDLVASVQNGQQVYRSYNEAPKNPRSQKQQAHRASFKNVVMFYKHGVQNFFKFAFQKKSNVESDFNAFMRFNAKRGVIVSKNASNLAEYPSLGHYILTDGTLPAPEFARTDTDCMYLVGATADAAPTTVGALSALMIEAGLAMSGDIVTTLNIKTTLAEGATLPAIDPKAGDYRTKWIIGQFLVNPADETACSEKGIECTRLSTGAIAIKIAGANMGAAAYEGIALVISRNTSNGLLVSHSELEVSDGIEAAIAASNDESFKSLCLTSWDASAPAILQGALTDQTATPTPTPTPTGKVTLTLSSNNTSLGSTTPSGTVEVDPGTSVQIKANILDDQAFFDGWSDGNEEQTRTIVVNNNMSLVATFSK